MEVKTIPAAGEPYCWSCGHSCIVAAPRGMATNGGCHCLDDVPLEQRQVLHAAFKYYRNKIKELKLAIIDLGGES